MERQMTISELFEMRNALAVEQYELYISTITNINMRYRDLLTNDLGSTLVKNCAWDAADIIVDRFFNTRDYYVSPQQMVDRIICFSYENDIDPLSDNAGIRKMVRENTNTAEVLQDIESTCYKAQKKLFEKENYVDENGKIKSRYVDYKIIKKGKDAYRESVGSDKRDELTDISQNQLDKPLQVDHAQAVATATYNSRYLNQEATQELKNFYNSPPNFQMLNSSANQSKSDVRVFSDGHTVISEKTLVKERHELTDKLRREIQREKGISQKEALKAAQEQAKKIISEKYQDITYKATAEQLAQATCDQWENSASAKENLVKNGILDENGKVKPEVRERLEKNLRKSMNAESKVILKNTDYKKVAEDAGKYTKSAVRKIIIGQVVYYVLPPLVFETRSLSSRKKMTLDIFLREIKKSGRRIVHYVVSKLGDIFKGIAGNTFNKFLKTFFDIIIETVKETVKRILKIIKQLVLSLVNCIRIITNKNATPAQKADSVSKLMSVTVSTVVLEILFEWMENQFGLPDVLMEPLQIIVTILVTNIIMLILQKADLFDVQYGLLVSNIQTIFEQENQIYLEESDRLKQQSDREAEEYMDGLHEEIAKIENSLADFDPFEGDACIELSKLNEIYEMGIDFKKEWIDFCDNGLVVGGD